jgi:hypothetical protein
MSPAARGSLERLGKGAGRSGCTAESQHKVQNVPYPDCQRREREMGTVPTVLAVLLTHSIRYKVYLLSSWEKFMFLAI